MTQNQLFAELEYIALEERELNPDLPEDDSDQDDDETEVKQPEDGDLD